mmetsp:Transcript_10830/g.31917  ORF Transcript_10830/g.31917 Transcript_10830/m.31917 type:complete len:273 (-) Transcript_10830:155-973(-)
MWWASVAPALVVSGPCASRRVLRRAREGVRRRALRPDRPRRTTAAAGRGRGAAHLWRHRGGRVALPRPRDRSPRPQARKHPHRRRRRAQADRLWVCKVYPAPLVHAVRHARVPRPRADPRARARQGGRLLGARHPPLRDAQRPLALRGRGPPRHVPEDPRWHRQLPRRHECRRDGPRVQAAAKGHLAPLWQHGQRHQGHQGPPVLQRHQLGPAVRLPRLHQAVHLRAVQARVAARARRGGRVQAGQAGRPSAVCQLLGVLPLRQQVGGWRRA